MEFLVTRGERIYFATANPEDRVKNTYSTGCRRSRRVTRNRARCKRDSDRRFLICIVSSITKKKKEMKILYSDENCIRLLKRKVEKEEEEEKKITRILRDIQTAQHRVESYMKIRGEKHRTEPAN